MKQKGVQYTPDLLTINIVNFFGLVNFLLLTILLLVWSKNTVDLVNYPGLVNLLLLTKKFTKSGVYCSSKSFRKNFSKFISFRNFDIPVLEFLN